MAEFFTQDNMFMLIGGLGIFIFGIKLMGDSLKALAGDKLRDLINKFTSNKFMAVLVGAGTTVAIQSSSGTTALTISLVRAGLMSLTQAIGVIMGANIGTTITAFLLGLAIKDYALIIAFFGSAIFMFAQKRKTTLYGQIIFGFGMLFYGMSLMEEPLKALSKTEEFTQIMQTVATTPLLGVIIGAVLTMIVQSSSATIGILQTLFASNALTFPVAFAILLGDNIGTTITSFLASIGGSRDSLRAALSHILFNIFGTVVFFTLMFGLNAIAPYESLISSITLNPKLQIAFMHIFFNATVTLMLIWFVKQIEFVVTLIVPKGKNEVTVTFEDSMLDENLISTSPSMAIAQAENTMIEMMKIVKNQTTQLQEYVIKPSSNSIRHIEQLEIGVNVLDKKLKVYLREVSTHDLVGADLQKLNQIIYSINDIERIGDHIENVAQKLSSLADDKAHLSKDAKDELSKMIKVSLQIIENLIKMYETQEETYGGQVYELEKHLDRLERKYYKRHLERVSASKCTGKYMISYVDILGDLERIGDHGQNIVEYFTNVDAILTDEENDIDLEEIIKESHNI